MQTLMTLLRSRVGIAISGVILIGTLGAFVGANSVPHPGATPTNGTTANTGSSAATAGNGTTSATQGNGSGPQNPSPTDTPAAAPTNPPATAPTAIPTGSVDLKGLIGSIGQNSTFTLNVGGTVVTIAVSGATNYSGDAKSFQALQQGSFAEVHGLMQDNGIVTAAEVNADTGAGN